MPMSALGIKAGSGVMNGNICLKLLLDRKCKRRPEIRIFWIVEDIHGLDNQVLHQWETANMTCTLLCVSLGACVQ